MKARSCKCGNGACAVREARGLTAFCQMAAPAARERDPRCFGSYKEAAEARSVGQRIRAHGGGTTGTAAAFWLVSMQAGA